MTTPSSFGSLMSSRSSMVNPVRVSVYLNGAGPGAAGRRVVLDRSDTLGENVQRIAAKLGLAERCGSNPRVYTKQGIEVADVDEVIEGEVLYFDPRGLPFSMSESGRSIDEGSVSFASSAASVDGSTVSATRSRRRRKNNRLSGGGLQEMPTSAGSSEGLRRASFGSRGSTATSATTTTAPPRLLRGNSFEYDFLLKFILVGSVAVGKSCLLLRFTDQRFRPTHETTIGVDFGSETIRVRDKKLKIQCWDTAGQEYFKAITRAYFREAAAALIVYDVTNRKSFEDLKQWLDNVRGTSTNRSLTITLVGNKCDKAGAARQVSSREGELFARDNGLLFLETSALSGENVSEVFLRTGDAVLRKIDQGLIDLDDPSQGVRRGDFSVDLVGNGLAPGAKPGAQRFDLGASGSALGAEGRDDQCYC